MRWLAELEQLRSTWHEATVANNFEDGVRRNMVEKYADPSHFVFELLQNAEDQGATEASFNLTDDCLIFEHNGSGFTAQDVENITGIGNSDKPDQPNKIGRFGIGFKSVFAITSRPEIYTFLEGVPFAFAIEHLVVPKPIAHTDGKLRAQWTAFVLPFLTENREELRQAVGERLESLGADTMLFLRNLAWIEWATTDRQGSYLCNRQDDGRVNLEEQVGAKGSSLRTAKSQYLLFSREINLEDADRDLQVSIGFSLQNGTIKPEQGQATLNVFFPTREATRLRFRMHGPFLLNDGRANLREHCHVNETLIGACSDLLYDTLPKLRDGGYLKPSCLEVLPIRPIDFEGSVFKPMYEATLRAFAQQPLLPTDEGTYVRSSKAKITDSQPLRNLLDGTQLSALFGEDGSSDNEVKWLASEIQKNATATKEIYDYLLRQLRVDEVDSEKLAARITGPFLAEQTDGWICSLYELLDNQQALWRPKTGHLQQGVLRTKPIIRTETGAQVAPFKADGSPRVFMPSGIGAPDTTVRRAIADNELAKSFLTKLGIEPRSSVDEVLEIVLPRIQSYDVERCLATYTAFLPAYLDDLKVIRTAIDNCSTQRVGHLRGALLRTPFVLAYNAEDDSLLSLLRPAEVVAPTEDLAFWFAGDESTWFVSSKIQDEADWQHICRFINQGQSVIRERLTPVFRKANPDGFVLISDMHGWHKRGLHRFDPDAHIVGLEHAMENINEPRAKLLWNLLLSYPYLIRGSVESSTRQTYENSETTEKVSVLGQLCLSNRWLPNAAGDRCGPEEVSVDELDASFESDTPQAEALASALGLKDLRVREALLGLGVASEDLWVFRSLAQNPSLLTKLKTELAAMNRAPFPNSSIPNLARLTQSVTAEATIADEISYESKTRSIRVSQPSGQESRTYLQGRYKDDDGELRCQCCENPMPFRLDDGSPYFEAVQFLRLVRREITQNRIAMCPVCAAKFQHALGNSDEEIYAQFMALSAECTTMPVVLARVLATIKFNPRHIVELQLAVKSASE